MMKKHITFNNFVLLLVAVIALAAFVLSFNTISKLGNSFFPNRGWIFAAMVDIAMIVLGLVRIQAGRMNDPHIKKWALIGLLASGVLSVLMNVVTTSGEFVNEWLHYVIHGLPPVALLSLSELALSMYDASRDTGESKSAMVMTRALNIVARLRKTLASARQELKAVHQSLARKDVEFGTLSAELATLQSEHALVLASNADLAVEVDKLRKELGKLNKHLAKECVELGKLPERVAYVARQTAVGIVPNGDMADRFGIGASSVERTMATLWPKEDRA